MSNDVCWTWFVYQFHGPFKSGVELLAYSSCKDQDGNGYQNCIPLAPGKKWYWIFNCKVFNIIRACSSMTGSQQTSAVHISVCYFRLGTLACTTVCID